MRDSVTCSGVAGNSEKELRFIAVYLGNLGARNSGVTSGNEYPYLDRWPGLHHLCVSKGQGVWHIRRHGHVPSRGVTVTTQRKTLPKITLRTHPHLACCSSIIRVAQALSRVKNRMDEDEIVETSDAEELEQIQSARRTIQKARGYSFSPVVSPYSPRKRIKVTLI